MDDSLLELQEEIEIRKGGADEPQERQAWQRRAKTTVELGAAGRSNVFDQVGRQPTYLIFEPLYPFRGEHRVQQPPPLLVVGSVDFEGDQPSIVAEAPPSATVAQHVGVFVEGENIVVAVEMQGSVEMFRADVPRLLEVHLLRSGQGFHLL
ncbi:hypothetical protein [Nocardia gamkensis]|uniref:hypothetical protein n=1 Tax=Nocardia gamkensis TaxID=352869 RepID=UPI0037A4AAD7